MTPATVKPPVKHSVLEALDIRVGTIVMVEDIPQSARLVRLTVDFGDHRRRIIAGLKQERENPKEIEGKQSVFVVNLEPKTIMGEVSEGMLLDIGYADRMTPCLTVPERPVPNGARAG
jgi:tRNA-binding protein